MNNLIPHIFEARLNLRDVDIFAPGLLALATRLLVLRGCRCCVRHIVSVFVFWIEMLWGRQKVRVLRAENPQDPLSLHASHNLNPCPGVRHGFQISAKQVLSYSYIAPHYVEHTINTSRLGLYTPLSRSIVRVWANTQHHGAVRVLQSAQEVQVSTPPRKWRRVY